MAIYTIQEPTAIAAACDPLIFKVEAFETNYSIIKILVLVYIRLTSAGEFNLVAAKTEVKYLGNDYYQVDVSDIVRSFLSLDLPPDMTWMDSLAVSPNDNSTVEYQVKFRELVEQEGVIVEMNECTSSVKVAINCAMNGADIWDHIISGNNDSNDESRYIMPNIYVRSFNSVFDKSFN